MNNTGFSVVAVTFLMAGALATAVAVIPDPADARGGGRGYARRRWRPRRWGRVRRWRRARRGWVRRRRSQRPDQHQRRSQSRQLSVNNGGNRGNFSGNNINRGNTNINTGNINRNNVNVNRNVNVNGGYYGGGYHGGGGCYGCAAVAGAVVGAAVTAAVIGSRAYALPSGCVAQTYGGAYYQCGSTWYQPHYEGANVTYVVVNPPQ